ncbi:MAG: HD domain-containing protein [Chlorobium sp.]|uniref:Pycsar system effector family protein n=1 Tax=Chlorobium sp. TaxID=1095 RepID=UPI002F41E975
MDNTTSITEKAADYVFRLFRERENGCCPYHNYAHTAETVDTCREIAEGMKATAAETEILLLAAWFHDTGFLFGIQDHEQKSTEIARGFLKENGYPEEDIEQVCLCILATKLPQQPRSMLEEIICDADLSHLGKPGYRQKSELVRLELEKNENRSFSDIEWLKLNIDFFNRNPFRTKYASLAFNTDRKKNLVDLHQRLRKKNSTNENGADSNQESEEKEKKKTKGKTVPERGLERNMEVYYRTSSRNHVDFSAIVDHKANIMIQTNSLIFSIIISLLVRKLDEFPELVAPTFVLLLSCVATIITSVLATRPKVTRSNTTLESIRERKANLLFFGSFINLRLDEFEWGMKEMLNDKSYYIDNMIRDTYFLGKVLDYKYRFLRLSYDIFMIGLVVSIGLYAFAFMK